MIIEIWREPGNNSNRTAVIMRVVVNSPRMRHGLGISSVKLMQIDERDDRYVINAMAI